MRLSQIIFPKFEKFSHLKATLNFCLNFVKSPQGKTGYYYRTLFLCEKENGNKSFLLIEYIPVELFPRVPSGFVYFFNSGKIVKKGIFSSLNFDRIDLTIPKN